MEFVLNGKRRRVPEAHPQTTLLSWLRHEGLTGSKEGCAEGECGACTVLLVRDGPSGSRFMPVNSCLVFLPMMAGQEVYTVEALAEGGELTEVQRAMAELGGSQCGYCTPGFVMSLFAEHYRPGRTGPCDPQAMTGNLCRCTGYRPIRDAALLLGPAPNDSFTERLQKPAPAVGAFESQFSGTRFIRPATLAECLTVLVAHPEARVVAGATDVAVESNLRDRRWPLLVSVEALAELKVFRDGNNETEIGAGLTLSEIEAVWEDAPRAAREWFPLFGSPQIRNRATVGGNLATASPIGDAAPLLLALGSQIRIAGKGSERLVPLDSFFRGYRETVLGAGELIVSVVVPKPYPSHTRFFKVAKRRMDDISTIAASFAMDVDHQGRVRRPCVAYGGVAPTPIRVRAAESALEGGQWDETAVAAAAEVVADQIEPLSDHRGSAEYRLAMAQTLLEKFWAEQDMVTR